MRIDLVKDKRISILGMARSGTAVAQLVRKYGGIPFVSEMKPAEKVTSEVRMLEEQGISFEVGGHTERAMREVDFFIVSPGIPATAPFMREIERRHLPVFSEIEVTSWLCPASIVAITGTNGKSTTTALMAHLLNNSGRKAIATGNIGSPFARDVISLSDRDFAVVEVSSFQLERIETFKPKVAAILNITPDHLDRYKEMSVYAEAKYRIADSQTAEDYLVLNADDEILQQAEFWGKPRILHFSILKTVSEGVFVKDGELVFALDGRSGTICRTNELGIPGPHNVANCASAAAMALALGVDVEDIAGGLKSFKGIPHRIETVGEINGVKYINDSKATNVDSVYVALQSIDRPMILIMGGRDKAGDFTRLAPLMQGRVNEIILIGEATEIIARQLAGVVALERAKDIYEAVQLAALKAAPGDAVMLSPGCASFDQFRDFEDRGDKFKEAVMALREERE
ncbi:MAG: UDP-N-acetylmuramoyl-L-alanine--D-glutamate ligase [Candidatus Zixiibacteriota bacterium]